VVFRGAGTVLNVATVVAGSGIGLGLGSRLPERTRTTVTEGLGLVVLLIAAGDAAEVGAPGYRRAVGSSATVLIVLGAVLLGGLLGSALRLADRVDGFGGWLQRRLVRGGAPAGHARFVEGFVLASLVFCVGPLTVLGALYDGLGKGIDQLALKSVLDGFASIAFAASLGWGVLLSVVTIVVVQGALTAVGALAGGLLPGAEIAALTATGGVLLVGVGVRLLGLRPLNVVDLLPALVVAPALTAMVAAAR
jgi:uncharacterized membrane protein YqgA involved in biofilm formation